MGDDYDITYTAGTSSSSYATANDSNLTVTIGGTDSDPTSHTITLDSRDLRVNMEMNDTGTEFTYNMPTFEQKDFVDRMPLVSRIEEMCDEYPALSKAYEQFKLIYKMTEQDYEGKLKERNI
jgi:hypothetical protein